MTRIKVVAAGVIATLIAARLVQVHIVVDRSVAWYVLEVVRWGLFLTAGWTAVEMIAWLAKQVQELRSRLESIEELARSELEFQFLALDPQGGDRVEK